MKAYIMRKDFVVALAVTGILAAVALPSRAEDNPGALAKALPEAGARLIRGSRRVSARGSRSQASSNSKTVPSQLSVYTMKAGEFSEVIVDHKTGAIKKAEKITDAEDLKNAKEQSEAMAKAKVDLDKAVEAATKANSGYRAVSAMPTLDAGKPVADITLMKGEQVKKVTEKLD